MGNMIARRGQQLNGELSVFRSAEEKKESAALDGDHINGLEVRHGAGTIG